LLVIGLLSMAVPISPLLRARVRRREAQAGRDEKVEQAFEVLTDGDLAAQSTPEASRSGTTNSGRTVYAG
jgi:hypothetical protein